MNKCSDLSKVALCTLIVLLGIALIPPLNAYGSGGKASPSALSLVSADAANATLPMGQGPTTRDVIVEWMETQSGQDRFNPEFIIVNQWDTVNLVFINNDTVAHDLVIGPPYNILVNASVPGLYDDVTHQEIKTPALHNSPGVEVTGTPGNVSASYSFVAEYPGIFEYVCTYHLDVGMIGYLVVLTPSSGNTGVTQPNATTQTEQQSPNAVQVSVDSGSGVNTNVPGYTPTDITVVVGVNNTVIWTNNDNMPHTVTALDGSFNSGNMKPGKSFTYTFTKAGVFSYTCVYHLWMHGTVTVVGAGGSPVQGSGDFIVVLTGHEIYGMIAFAIVILFGIMLIFTKTRHKEHQT